jgi:putative SOS response-associated peptidase YedK
MCYNVAYIESKIAKYAQRYKEVLPIDFEKTAPQNSLPTYYFVSGFAHPQLPIIKHDGLFLFEWGLIPSWAKDNNTANQISAITLNAMGETVFEKPSFKNCITTQRCLLGISGFYEWQESNKEKIPYFIKTKSNELFSLACIYDSWIDPVSGQHHNTFSILTCPANPLMQSIHNIKKRMPVILSTENEKHWIDPALNSAQIKELIAPYNQNDMTAYKVSKKLNSAKNNRNVPESMLKVDYQQNTLF